MISSFLSEFEITADQQHMMLMLDPPLRGHKLESEVGCAAADVSDDTVESCSGKEVFSRRICATCRG